MSLNYSFTGDWDAATKESVGKWVKEKLTVVQDGEPPEDLFLEYIIVMIGNGKKMQELSHELQDFIGEKSANDFAADLGTYLQSITSSETATQPLEEVEEPQAVSLNIVKSNKDILEGGLSSSRSTGPTIQKSSRLLDNALKSTTSSHKRNSSGNQFSHSAPPVGITTQSSQKNAAGGASGPGLFTKRGMANSITADSGRNRDVDDQHKKRKIIMEGIDPGMVGSRDMRIGGPAFGPGQNFPQPMPIGFPATMDPSAMYMEQMNMMARMSGFGNVEDMMHFQQNMMANMMGGGGMPMPMMMPAPFGGRQMPPYDQQAQMFHNQFERGYRGQIGGRGAEGRGGRGFQKERSGNVSNNNIVHKIAPPPGPPPVTSMPPPTPTQPVAAAVTNINATEMKQKAAVTTPASTSVTSALVDPIEDQHEGGAYEYSGIVGGPGGYRGRGRGRGRGFSRGGFYGNSVVSGRGRGSSAIDEIGGRFGNSGRGRGAYRGRGGYHGTGVGGPVLEGAPVAGPPVSHNKVWVREVDIESPLVAGR